MADQRDLTAVIADELRRQTDGHRPAFDELAGPAVLLLHAALGGDTPRNRTTPAPAAVQALTAALAAAPAAAIQAVVDAVFQVDADHTPRVYGRVGDLGDPERPPARPADPLTGRARP